MRIIAFAIAAAILLAGCTTDEEPASNDQAPADVDDVQAGNETAAPAPAADNNGTADPVDAPEENQPPVLTVQLDQTEGTVPFDVLFTINGTDADGDALEWIIEHNGEDIDGGNALPAESVHSFDTEGTFNFTVYLWDGSVAVNETLTVVAVAASPAEPTGPQPIAPETFEAFVDTSCFQCTPAGGADACVSFQVGVSTIDCAFFELAPRHQEQPFTATSDLEDTDLQFRTDCSSGSDALDLHANGGPEAGTVPAGAGCVVLWDPSGVPIPTLMITIGG